MDHTDVRATGNLQPAAEAHAMHRRDHRNRQLAPDHGRLLEPVGIAKGALCQFGFVRGGFAGKGGDVEPGAERASLARQNHRPQPLHLAEPVPRSEEHTSELQSLMSISYDVFCWKKKNTI